MLSPRTQKVKSKILTVLWKADPFEAKWSILAKSYSILRGDRDKEEVSLDKFLELCAPLIGVIPPEIYLSVMGWELGESHEQDQVSALTAHGFPVASQKMITHSLLHRRAPQTSVASSLQTLTASLLRSLRLL
jgi:hypothetical protein